MHAKTGMLIPVKRLPTTLYRVLNHNIVAEEPDLVNRDERNLHEPRIIVVNETCVRRWCKNFQLGGPGLAGPEEENFNRPYVRLRSLISCALAVHSISVDAVGCQYSDRILTRDVQAQQAQQH